MDMLHSVLLFKNAREALSFVTVCGIPHVFPNANQARLTLGRCLQDVKYCTSANIITSSIRVELLIEYMTLR
jgi:hypothetical protein